MDDHGPPTTTHRPTTIDDARRGQSSVIRRPSSEIITRVISAAIGIPLFLGVAWWGAVPFGVGVIVLALLGLGEMYTTYRKHGLNPNPCLAILGPCAVLWPLTSIRDEPATSGLLTGSLALGMISLAAAAPIWEVIRAAKTGELTTGRNIGTGALCGGYVALFACVTALRMLQREEPVLLFTMQSTWWQPLFVTIFSIWATDSAAYFVGKSLGTHKLAPLLSPGKTIEGTVGGLTAALIVGGCFGAWLLHSWGTGLAIGAIAGVFGQIGDLFKSALKREVGVKDFGGILPGHGGVLDRFDSLLFVAPLVLLLFLLRS